MEEKRKWIRKESYNKSMWFAYATMWIAISAAVIAGLIIAGNMLCLVFHCIKSKFGYASVSDNYEEIDRFVDDLM